MFNRAEDGIIMEGSVLLIRIARTSLHTLENVAARDGAGVCAISSHFDADRPEFIRVYPVFAASDWKNVARGCSGFAGNSTPRVTVINSLGEISQKSADWRFRRLRSFQRWSRNSGVSLAQAGKSCALFFFHFETWNRFCFGLIGSRVLH